ncbi:MAG: glycosyltransferase, partial [Candidatus Omnitrophica bacterium]|nr:glycosyltransferase [Candidatus Omnitrophota bacterium]
MNTLNWEIFGKIYRFFRDDKFAFIDKSKILVWVLNYNNKETIIKACKSLIKENPYNYTVYVVDQGSIDGSPQFIKRKFKNEKKLRLIKFNKNLGVARGRNYCLKIKKLFNYDFVVMFDSDAQVNFLYWLDLAIYYLKFYSLFAVSWFYSFVL